MKIKYLLPIILLFLATTVSAETLQVNFTDDQEPAPQAYKLYLEKNFVCEFQNDETGQGSCEIPPIPYGGNSFTMTAASGEFESAHSLPYVFNKDIGAPTINAVVTISINLGR